MLRSTICLRGTILSRNAQYHTQRVLLKKKKKEISGKKVKLSEKEISERLGPLLHKDSPYDYVAVKELFEKLPVASPPKPRQVPQVRKVRKQHQLASPIIEDMRKLTNPKWRIFLARKVRRIAGVWAVFPHICNPFLPRINLLVEYPNNELVYFGKELKWDICQHKPKVTIQIPYKTVWWTLVFIGQDVLEPKRQSIHGIWVNMTKSIDEADEILPYKPPGPFVVAGLHRYTWLLCSQQKKFEEPSASQLGLPENYQEFNFRKFMERNSELIPKAVCVLHLRSHPFVPDAAQLFENNNYPGSTKKLQLTKRGILKKSVSQ